MVWYGVVRWYDGMVLYGMVVAGMMLYGLVW